MIPSATRLCALCLMLFTSSCCFDGWDCCNPDMTPIVLSDNVLSYFPEIDSVLNYISEKDTIVGIVQERSFQNGEFFSGGDECPDVPGIIFKFSMSLGSETLLSVSNELRGESVIVEMGDLRIPLSEFRDSVYTSNWHKSYNRDYIKNELLDSIVLGRITYFDVLQGESSQGMVSRALIARNQGLIAFVLNGKKYHIK